VGDDKVEEMDTGELGLFAAALGQGEAQSRFGWS